jgi:hypothetical protein
VRVDVSGVVAGGYPALVVEGLRLVPDGSVGVVDAGVGMVGLGFVVGSCLFGGGVGGGVWN